MNAIMIQNLKKNYGSFEVSLPRLDLRQGYVTGLVGKNGSGKTTLIRSVLGVIPRTAGTVQVLGGDITADPAIREQVGFVSETPYYIPTLTTEMVHEMVRPFYPRWDEELYQEDARRNLNCRTGRSRSFPRDSRRSFPSSWHSAAVPGC